MKQSTRITIAALILVGLVVLFFGLDAYQRSRPLSVPASSQVTLAPGSIPIYLDGQLAAGFSPTDLDKLEKVSFVEQAEGVTQEGWMLKDILGLHLEVARLKSDSRIVVSSSSRGKSAELTWSEVENPENMVMFDLSNRGTLKLVSKMEKLDTRDEWIQDTDKVEVIQP
jgi:hypothetical protein